MTHYLWDSQDWKNADIEAVVAALFDAPRHIDPFDMAKINAFHPSAKATYLNMFYSGNMTESIKKVNKV